MKELLLVYTMGKVASTTVSESLLESGVICYDVHTLKKETILRNLQHYIDQNQIPSNHYGRSIDIYQRFQKRKKVAIITLVRDCLSYNISKVFQNLPRGSYTLGQIRKQIQDSPPNSAEKWLEHELKATTGIDVFAYPFDKDANFTSFTQDRYRVLVMRYDLPDKQKVELISDFVAKPVKLTTKNDSSRKWYAALYSDFKQHGSLRKAYVDACFDSAYMRHFYSEAEIAQQHEAAKVYYSKVAVG